MIRDIGGYYTLLEVDPGATDEEIKLAYRSLAKRLHPDVNPDPAATERFKLVTSAYEILSNPETREHYDKGVLDEEEDEEEALNPITCSYCHDFVLEPRLRTYRYVVGLGLTTHVKEVHGLFCHGCASKIATRSSLKSALLGWWGLPKGPFLTVGAILLNAFGGKRHREMDDLASWHNAQAFRQLGENDLAMALALSLQKAKDPDIARRARAMVEKLYEEGLPYTPLKPVWAVTPDTVFKHLFMLILVPCIIWATLFPSTRSTELDDAPVEAVKPHESPSEPLSLAAPAQFEYHDDAYRASPNACDDRPQSGQFIHRPNGSLNTRNELKLRNASNRDAIVQLRSADSGGLVGSFFLAKNSETVVSGFPDGAYRVQFAYGDAMTADCRSFFDPEPYRFMEAQAFPARAPTSVIIPAEITGSMPITGITTNSFRDR